MSKFRTVLGAWVVLVLASPAVGGQVQFDMTYGNYDNLITYGEAQYCITTYGSPEYVGYNLGDHHLVDAYGNPWGTTYRGWTYATQDDIDTYYDTGYTGLPNDGEITTAYGDFQIAVDNRESDPITDISAKNSLYAWRGNYSGYLSYATGEMTLPAGQQGCYMDVNFLLVGNRTDRIVKIYAVYEGDDEELLFSGGVPHPSTASPSSPFTTAGPTCTVWWRTKTSSPYYSYLSNGGDVPLYIFTFEDAIELDPEKKLVGFKVECPQVAEAKMTAIDILAITATEAKTEYQIDMAAGGNYDAYITEAEATECKDTYNEQVPDIFDEHHIEAPYGYPYDGATFAIQSEISSGTALPNDGVITTSYGTFQLAIDDRDDGGSPPTGAATNTLFCYKTNTGSPQEATMTFAAGEQQKYSSMNFVFEGKGICYIYARYDDGEGGVDEELVFGDENTIFPQWSSTGDIPTGFAQAGPTCTANWMAWNEGSVPWSRLNYTYSTRLYTLADPLLLDFNRTLKGIRTTVETGSGTRGLCIYAISGSTVRPDPSLITASVSPDWIGDEGTVTATMTIKVYEPEGRKVGDIAGDLSVVKTAGAGSVSIGTITETSTPGIYQCTITGTSPGAVELTAYVYEGEAGELADANPDDMLIYDEDTTYFVTADVSPRVLDDEGSGTATMTIEVCDGSNDPVTGLANDLTVVEFGDGTVSVGAVSATQTAGEYQCTITGTGAGDVGLMACLYEDDPDEVSDPDPDGVLVYDPDTTFFIAPDGDDQGEGTLSDPWKTPTLVENQLSNGDMVVMLPGDYGITCVLDRTGYSRASWNDGNVWRAADPGDESTWPTFTKLYVDSGGTAYISIKGIKIVAAEGTSTTDDYAVIIEDTIHLLVEDAYVEGYQKEHPDCDVMPRTEDGVIWRKKTSGQTFGDLTFRRCDIGHCGHILQSQYVDGNIVGDVVFDDCKLHNFTATCALIHGDDGYWVRMHDCEFHHADFNELWAAHGNTIKATGDYIELLRCHIHGGKGSRMYIGNDYGDTDQNQNGIGHFTMRDCVVYSSRTSHPTVSFSLNYDQYGGVKSDIIITGNTIVPIRPSSYKSQDDDLRYVLALRLAVNPTASGENIVVANNILAGKVILDLTDMVSPVITGNMMWAYNNGSGLQQTATGNTILCYGDDLFNSPCDINTWMEIEGNLWVGGDEWANHSPVEKSGTDCQAILIDAYHLADDEDNPAWDLGDGDYGNATDYDGVTRDEETPDSGAFEFCE